MPARDQHLDRDAVPRLHPPSLGRAVAYGVDRTDRLVAGNHRKPDGQHPSVLLGVAPADPAGLDPQEPAVGVDLGNGQLAKLEGARRGLHDGAASALGHPPGS
jgi:hypothetical protein